MGSTSRLPAVFLAHGSPMLAIEQDDFTAVLKRLGTQVPRPRAIVVVSAHWEAPGPVRVTISQQPPLFYDFSGFPEELYHLRYPAPGNPALAGMIGNLLSDASVEAVPDPHRGLDHGAWVPLKHAFPSADIPVVEVSLPTPRTPAEVIRIGKALAPLRDRGILLIGSGGIVHNLRRVRMGDKQAPVDAWAKSFDDWVQERLKSLDLESLADYRRQAPEAALSVPTSEHFDPLFFVLGAAGPGDRVSDLYEGFHYGNLSMRSFALNS
jgi:4,5-DOPA dioxygenase extradiol